MLKRARRTAWLGLCVALVAGCSQSASKSDSKTEAGVKSAFAAFQNALAERDSVQLWAFLDRESQEDAERVAKLVKEEYEKATPEKTADQEKAYGLTAAEMAGLKGEVYVKSSRFHGKFHEVPGSKLDKVVLQPDGQKATVHYTEEDGENEKLNFVRQSDKWKVSIKIPQ